MSNVKWPYGKRMTAPIKFYFDFISHNAYLAWTQIHRTASKYGREVEPIPVLFAGFLEHYGQKGPAEVPPKAHWMIRDVIRKAAELNVPLRPPASHPFNPIMALRVATVDLPPVDKKRLIDAIFRATWADGRDISDPDVLGALLTNAGFDANEVLAASKSPAVKQKLIDAGKFAIEKGVFGVPSMRIDNELFWGYDDLHYMELYLQGRDPFDPSRLEPWLNVRPSIQRKAVSGKSSD